MVIVLKEYKFHDGNKTAELKISIPKHTNPDVILRDAYIRVSFPPDLKYIFELDFHDLVHSDQAQCSIGDDEVTIMLPKQVEGRWEEATFNGARSDRVARRKIADQVHDEKLEKRQKQQAFERAEVQRAAVRSQMAVENAEAASRNARKEAMRQAAIREVFGSDSTTTSTGTSATTTTSSLPTPEHDFSHPIRRNEPVRTRLTRRVLPTPARESTREEEEAYLKEQQYVRNTIGGDSNDGDDDDKFISEDVYSEVLTTLKHVGKIVNDDPKHAHSLLLEALNMMGMGNGNGSYRQKHLDTVMSIHMTLASVKIGLGDLIGARSTLSDAASLCKYKVYGVGVGVGVEVQEAIKSDLEEIESALAYIAAKKQGDSVLKAQSDYESAMRWYTRALRTRSSKLQCVIDTLLCRALAALHCMKWDQAILDCNAVLKFISFGNSAQDTDSAGFVKYEKCALTRRCVAYEGLGLFSGAIGDLEKVEQLCVGEDEGEGERGGGGDGEAVTKDLAALRARASASITMVST